MIRRASNIENLAKFDVEYVAGDLRNYDFLCRALKGCQVVFHVAADYRLWVPNPVDMYDVNVRGTARFLKAALSARVERIVYTSSVATLGIPANGMPGGEETPVSLDKMIGHYQRSKFLAEAAVRQMAAEDGCPVVIVNPSAPLGPGDIKPTPTGQVVLNAIRGRIPAHVNTGLNIVHVDDVANGHVLALQHGHVGERYVLGGDNITFQAMLTQTAAQAEYRPPRVRLPHSLAMGIAYANEAWARIVHRPPRMTLDSVRMSRHKMHFSSKKAQDQLGYTPRPAYLAITDSVRWFKNFGVPMAQRQRVQAYAAGSGHKSHRFAKQPIGTHDVTRSGQVVDLRPKVTH
jgi:dihydroflavonol-4-reductase